MLPLLALVYLLSVASALAGENSVDPPDPLNEASTPILYPPPRGATDLQQRQSLRRALANKATPPEWDGIRAVLLDGDAESRRLAAAITLRSGDISMVPALVEYCARADLNDLRSVVEWTPRPASASFAPVVTTIQQRFELGSTSIASRLAGRLERATAERLLLEMVDAGPLGAAEQITPVRALDQIAGPDSITSLAPLLTESNRPVSAAARETLDSLRDRLLASARLDDCQALDREARRYQPQAASTLLREAQLLGLYSGRPDAGLDLVDEVLASSAISDQWDASRPAAEALLGSAVILFFAGREAESRSRLAEALVRLGTPPPTAVAAATVHTRIHLVTAILAVDWGDAKQQVWSHLRAAVEHSPFERDYSLFDQAMYGDFGPLRVLDRLRRTDRVDSQLRFLEHLDRFLAIDASGSYLGIPLVGSREAPEAGSNEAAAENERVKSWVPWWRLVALYQAGQPQAASVIGERVVEHLHNTNIWENRKLAAQVNLELGKLHARASRAVRAEDAYHAAIAIYSEIDQALMQQDMSELTGRFRAGDAPYERPFRGLLASARVGLSEVYLLLLDQPEKALEEARKAYALAPDSDDALVNLACFLAHDEDPDRAIRTLRSLPRTGGLLLGLARLATALGATEQATQLFDTHLMWNALTPASKAIEGDWWKLIVGQ